MFCLQGKKIAGLCCGTFSGQFSLIRSHTGKEEIFLFKDCIRVFGSFLVIALTSEVLLLAQPPRNSGKVSW